MSFRVSLFYLSVIISFGLSVFLSVLAHLHSSSMVDSDQSEACLDDLEALLGNGIDGWEGHHRS